MNKTLNIQRARRSEYHELCAMQRASMRELWRSCYDEAAIEAVITHAGTMDISLIDDGTFFSARIGRVLVASGGWTTRIPSYQAHMESRAGPTVRGEVTIRSIFVHPAWARRGIARRIMARVEDDITAAGFASAALTSTLAGIPFYRQLGYTGQEPAILKFPGDVVFLGLNMRKRLTDGQAAFSHAA